MGLDVSGILNAVQLTVDKSIQDAGYDRTVIGTIVECIDPENNSYKVKYQDSVFTAIAYNAKEFYEKEEAVYITFPSNDINYTKSIVGKVSSQVLDLVNLSTTELSRYSSLGTMPISSDKLPLTEENKNVEVKIDNTDDDNEVLKSGFMASPYFVLKTNITCNVDNTDQKTANYGIRITLHFKSEIRDMGAVTYEFNLNDMSGMPFQFKNKEQYKIFTINNAKYFDKIDNIEFFSEGFNEGEQYTIDFKNTEFYVASKSGEEVSKYSVEITPRDISSIRDFTDTVVLNASVKIGNEKFTSDNIEYYWFIEDLRVVNKSSDGYNSYGGLGWRCLNKTLKFVDNDVHVTAYKNGGNSLTIYHRTQDVLNSFTRNNIYKCVIKYRENAPISNEFTVIDYKNEDYNLVLSSSIVELFKKDNQYIGDDEEYDYTQGVNSTSLRLSDKAKISIDFNKEENENENVKYTYIWQLIDKNNNSISIKEEKNNNYQTIFGDVIDDKVTYKCAVLKDDKYLGSSRIILTNVEQSLTMRLVSKINTFNSLTNNGEYQGIFYAKEIITRDKDTNKITDISYEPIKNVEEVQFKDKDIKLFINAEYIKTGHLEVSGYDLEEKIKRTVFYADIDNYQKTQIGGFIVTPKALFNNDNDIIIDEKTEIKDIPQKDISTINKGVYLGIDGIFVGNNEDNYFRIDKDKDDKWKLEITGNITANSGKIGGFIIDKEDLSYGGDSEDYSFYLSGGDINNYFIYAQQNAGGENNSTFYVTKNGQLYANDAFIEGEIIATSGKFNGTIEANDGKIGGFTIKDNQLQAGSSTNFIALNSDKDNEYFIWAGSNIINNNTPFWIKKDGSLKATGANISGIIETNEGTIGNFILKGNQLKSNNLLIDSTNTSSEINVILAGNINSPIFSINNKGKLIARNAELGNFKIYSVSDNLQITSIDYQLKPNNGYISITATIYYSNLFYKQIPFRFRFYLNNGSTILPYLSDDSQKLYMIPNQNSVELSLSDYILNNKEEKDKLFLNNDNLRILMINNGSDEEDHFKFENYVAHTWTESQAAITDAITREKAIEKYGYAYPTGLKVWQPFSNTQTVYNGNIIKIGNNKFYFPYVLIDKTQPTEECIFLIEKGFLLLEERVNNSSQVREYLTLSSQGLTLGSQTLTEADIEKLHNL